MLAINSGRHAATGLSPYETVLGYRVRLPLDAALEPLARPADRHSSPAAEDFLATRRAIWSRAGDGARAAQARQKRNADKHRHAESFDVGDDVLLSTEHLKLPQPAAAGAGARRTEKLMARFVGPFKITRVINANAYELGLPASMRIASVQNISFLRRYKHSPPRFAGRPDPRPRPPPEADSIAGEPAWEVRRVLAKKLVGRSVHYLVEWVGYPLEESTWEPVANLQCPDLLRDFNASQDDFAAQEDDADVAS